MNTTTITPQDAIEIIEVAAASAVEPTGWTGYWSLRDVEHIEGSRFAVTYYWRLEENSVDFYVPVRQFAEVAYDSNTPLEDVDFAAIAEHLNDCENVQAEHRKDDLTVSDIIRAHELRTGYGNIFGAIDADTQMTILRSVDMEIVFEEYSYWTAEKVAEEYREYYAEQED